MLDRYNTKWLDIPLLTLTIKILKLNLITWQYFYNLYVLKICKEKKEATNN